MNPNWLLQYCSSVDNRRYQLASKGIKLPKFTWGDCTSWITIKEFSTKEAAAKAESKERKRRRKSGVGQALRIYPKYPEARLKIGHAQVFENIVVYGDPAALGKRKRSQLGKHLGTVKGVIPEDPYRVLYEHLKSSPAFKQRQKIRKHLKKIGLRKRELRSQRRL